MRILLVEKERIIRELLETLLRDAGRRVDIASSCAEALVHARESPAVDVALIEKKLPDGDGLDLAQRLKASDANIEVLLMSAAPSLEAVLESIEAGASDFIPKPFDDINQVAVRIAAAGERAKLRRAGQWLHSELVESEERYRKLFEATPDAVLLIDVASNRVTDANPAAIELYGYEPSELIGLNADQLRAIETSTPDSEPPVPPSSVPGIITRKHARRDGTALDVELVKGNFNSRDRNIRVEIIREIGDRLRAQAAQRELESQLLQAQKMEALGQLAGGIAHDFNNLLAVILNYTRFVQESIDQGPTRSGGEVLSGDVEQILSAATSAQSLTRQLLAFSRRELVQPDVLNVNEIVQSLERILQRTLGSHIELVTQLEARRPYVRLDRGQLESAIVNLVVNARDAMPQGGRLVVRTVEDSQKAQNGSKERSILLEIQDNGQGIHSQVVDQIFDPFFTTKSRDKGTGLGLAMVKGVVEHAGGSVDVSTQPGKGSTFSLRLPATTDPLPARPKGRRSPAASHSESHIMVVDDDDAVRRAIVRILKSAGYSVVSASGSAEALSKHSESPKKPSLILTDVLMAEIKGDELVRRLRERQPKLRAVFVTGLAASSLLDIDAASGQQAVLPKPFTQERLLEVVHDVLDAT